MIQFILFCRPEYHRQSQFPHKTKKIQKTSVHISFTHLKMCTIYGSTLNSKVKEPEMVSYTLMHTDSLI